MDGEGCISISNVRFKRKTRTYKGYVFRIVIVVTNKPVIDWIHFTFGGHKGIHKSALPSKKKQYLWSVRVNEINFILKGCLPYLKIKHKQALLMLKFRATYKGYHRNNIVPKSVLTKRKKLLQGIRELNR